MKRRVVIRGEGLPQLPVAATKYYRIAVILEAISFTPHQGKENYRVNAVQKIY